MSETKPAPVCLHCGKPLKKFTVPIWFEPGEYRNLHHESATVVWLGDTPRPQTKAEAQRYSNLPVISVHKSYGGISYAGTWDGESYGIWGEGLFCTKECGFLFGRDVAKLLKERRKT